MYWSDLYNQVIEKVNYNSGKREIVFQSEVHLPESLIVFKGSLYWLSKGSTEVKKCKLYGSNKGQCETIYLYLYDVKFLTVMQEQEQRK